MFLSLGKIFTSTLNLSVQVLQRILMGTDVVKNVNKNNASHAVLFEALALVSSRPKIVFPSICFPTHELSAKCNLI